MNDTVAVKHLRPLLAGNPYLPKLDYVDDDALLPRRKIDNLALAIQEYEANVDVVASLPFFYNLGLTDHCNLRCELCPTGKMSALEQRGFMSWELFTRLVNEIADHAILLNLAGWGEPTLHPRFLDCVEYAARRDIFTYVPTNFSLHYDNDFFTRLIDSGLTCLHVDMDGMTQRSYEKYRVGGNLGLVKNNLEKLVRLNRSHNLKIEAAMIAMRHNEEEIPAFQKYCAELGVDFCQIGRLQVDPETRLDWLPENPEHRYNNYLERDPPKDCSRLYLQMVVRWDGGVPPCCLAYGKINDVTNVSQSTLGAEWNNPAFRAARACFSGKRGEIATLCHRCRNDLGSRLTPHYTGTFAITLPAVGQVK